MTKKLLVLDNNGQLVLKSADGKTQPIPKPRGAWALLLIDCSSSMSGPKIDQAREGILSFATEAEKKGYSVGVIGFASEAMVLSEPGQGISALASCVQQLEADGSTNMADAITLAVEVIGARNGSRTIVVVSDGEPDSADAAIRAANKARGLGIDIITIGVDGANTEFLRLIATPSDLSMYVPVKELQSKITAAARMLPGL